MDDQTATDRDQAAVDERAERIAAEIDWRDVTVPPNTWTSLGRVQRVDTVIELKHSEIGNVVFRVSANDPTLIVDSTPPLEHGYRLRYIPREEIGKSWVDEPELPEHTAGDLVAGHPLVVERQAARDRADASIRAAIDEGWLIELDKPDDTGARFLFTEAGKRHAEEVLGLPAGSLG
jgi:hypothetical protein